MSNGFIGMHMSKAEIDALEYSFDNAECIEFVEEHLIDMLENEIAIGVCKCFIKNGYMSMSDKQKNAFKVTLQQNLLKCGRCEEFLWEEANYIIDNGLCTYCQQIWDNS